MPAEPVLALDDIQANSVIGFRKPNQSFAFLRLEPGPAAAGHGLRWLGELAPQLSDARHVLAHSRAFRAARGGDRAAAGALGAAPPVWVNVAVTAACLARFGLDVTGFADEAFRVGLARRSSLLGDPIEEGAPGHPGRWQFGGAAPCDAVLTVASDDRSACLARADALVTEAGGAGWALVHRVDGADLPGERKGQEHFGFRDGVSMPALRGRASNATGDFVAPRRPGGGRGSPGPARPGQVLLWPGQVLLGHPRQDPRNPAATIAGRPAGPAWSDNGSYLVVRKLAQDVDAFWRFARRHAPKVGSDGRHFASLLVGRWPSGAPLSLSPQADDLDLAADAERVNDFAFGTDPEGVRCPLAAHIRKVNPRDLATDQGGANDTLTRLLMRRGIPFEEAPGPGEVGGRGLMFAAYMSSIVDQFEFVQRTWANSPDLPEPGAGHDLLVGQRQDATGARSRRIRLVDTAGRPVTVRTLVDFVTPIGGEYFFAPSISAVSSRFGLG